MKFIIGWVSYKKVNINEQTYIIYLCQRPRTVVLIHYYKGYQFHHTFSIGKCLHAFCFDTQRSTTRHVMSKFRLLTCSVSNWWRIADIYVIKQGEKLEARKTRHAPLHGEITGGLMMKCSIGNSSLPLIDPSSHFTSKS